MNTLDCDVAIIGGGPTGAAAAITLARAGLAALIIEKERFPRFHVGESLLPLQGALLARLGLGETMATANFVPKYGAWFVANDGSATNAIDFERELAPPHNSAFEVERSRFDELLLRHAEASGARVLEQHAVLEADLAASGSRLQVRSADGNDIVVSARWVLDASGQNGFLARRLGLRETLEGLRKVAHFAHFQGGRRRPGRREGDISIVLGEGCWFWHIPLAGGKVSVGCVVDHSRWKGSGADADSFLRDTIASSPWLREWLSDAHQITPAHTLANFSYTSKRLTGEGWMLAGDAAMFLDPIFSTGVFLGMRSGEAAAQTLVQALKSDRAPNGRELAAYERRLRRWSGAYFRLIRAFYQPRFGSILLSPVPFFQRPLTHFLAGRLELSLWQRAILELLLLIARANRRWGFIPDPRPSAANRPHG